MLEHFNDYISIGLLIMIVLAFLYVGLRFSLKAIERSRIKREIEYLEKRKEEK